MTNFRPLSLGLTYPWRYLEHYGDAIIWRARDTEEIWVGIGSAFESQNPEECLAVCAETDARELPFAPRCFGALAFDPERPMDGEWSLFSTRRFWIPAIQIRWTGEQAAAIVSGSGTVQLLPDISFADGLVGFDAKVRFTEQAWEAAVNYVRSQIAQGQLRKAVLARRYEIATDREKQPARVLKRLHQQFPNCYLIGYRQNSSDMFFSITPERLFRIAAGVIDVDSLAGTDKVTDEYLRQVAQTHYPLLDSEKDREEQQIVTDFIQERLNLLCEEVYASGEPRIRNFGNIVHLYTNLGGRLKTPVPLSRILETLHPTSAVCGEPTAIARELIAGLEPEMRGLYAGVIGMYTADQAEFAVTIRSGLVHSDSYSLYVGAGIVRASDAEAESRECLAKMTETLRVIL